MKKRVNMKRHLSLNILRLGLVLVFIGIFLPISCDSNGYQIARGILRDANQSGKLAALVNIENIYGFMIYAVFLLALLGLIITFLNKGKNNFYYGFFCLITSFVLVVIILNKFKFHLDSKEMAFFINVGIPIKVKLLAGWYSMIAGYIAGAVVFILKAMKIIFKIQK